FVEMSVEGNQGIGLNANNLTDVDFSELHILRTGMSPTEPSVLIDEARGTLRFRRCTFMDGAGGAVVVQQLFNAARLVFDLCEIAAPQRSADVALFRANVSGQGRLAIAVTNLRVHDAARGAIAIDAKDQAAVSLTLGYGYFAQVASPAVIMTFAGGSTGCLDPTSTNTFPGTAPPYIRLTARDKAQLRTTLGPDAVPMVLEGTAAAGNCLWTPPG